MGVAEETSTWEHRGMQPTVAPERLQVEDTSEETEPDRPWLVIVWNDPINLMSYVTWVLQKLFGYSRSKATKLMLDVHHKGKAIVGNGRERRPSWISSGSTASGCGQRSRESNYDAGIPTGCRRGGSAETEKRTNNYTETCTRRCRPCWTARGLHRSGDSARTGPIFLRRRRDAAAFHKLMGTSCYRDNKLAAVRTMKERVKGQGPLGDVPSRRTRS